MFTKDSDPTNWRLGPQQISIFEIVGTNNSAFPENMDLKLVALHDITTPEEATEHLYPYIGNYYSEGVTAYEPTGADPENWIAFGRGSDLGSLNDCTPDCIWEGLVVEIRDEERAASDSCSDYLSEVYICPSFEPFDSGGESTADATCVPGSGRFAFFPTHQFDRDGDGDRSLILRPIMLTGTGSLTGAAWIDSITPATTWDHPIQVALVQEDGLTFGQEDTLDSWSGITSTIPTEGLSFTQTLSGSAPFIVEEFPNGETENYQVDMTWSCGELPDERILPRPRGYLLELDEIGCYSSPAQDLILRIGSRGPSEMLITELYGLPRVDVRLPISTTENGKSFTYDHDGVSISGTITEVAPTHATVEFSEFDYLGVSFCEEGVYQLPTLQVTP